MTPPFPGGKGHRSSSWAAHTPLHRVCRRSWGRPSPSFEPCLQQLTAIGCLGPLAMVFSSTAPGLPPCHSWCPLPLLSRQLLRCCEGSLLSRREQAARATSPLYLLIYLLRGGGAISSRAGPAGSSAPGCSCSPLGRFSPGQVCSTGALGTAVRTQALLTTPKSWRGGQPLFWKLCLAFATLASSSLVTLMYPSSSCRNPGVTCTPKIQHMLKCR